MSEVPEHDGPVGPAVRPPDTDAGLESDTLAVADTACADAASGRVPGRPRRRGLAGSLDDAVTELVDELIAEVDLLNDHMMTAARNGVPLRYRHRMGDEDWDEMSSWFLPAVLRGVRAGAPLPEEVLEKLRRDSRDRHQTGLPLLIALSVCRAGVAAFSGYVVRKAGPRRLPAAVVVLGRAAVLSHDTAQAAAAGYPLATEVEQAAVPAPRPALEAELAPVPRRILELAAQGLSTREIAHELHYSEQAVTYHLGTMMKRFGAPNRTALIARAVQRGVVTLPERDAS
jgi:DNA-binding CsgD family transcriptional regulator